MYGNPAPGPSRGPGNPPVNVAPPQIRTARSQPGQPMPGNMPGAGQPTSRIGEMLDQVKAEYEAAIQQLNIAKMEQLDTERKIQAQVVEMDQIQQTLKTLEANHRRVRQQYEDDMMRMRHQLEGSQNQSQNQQVKPPAKRHRPSPSPTDAESSSQAGMPPSLGVGVGNVNVGLGNANRSSPLRPTPQVPHAGASLHSLTQQQQAAQPPPHLAPLDPQQAPTNRRIPSLRDQEQNGKSEARALPPVGGNGSDSGRSSPVVKTKAESGEPSAGAANGKASLPSLTRETSNAGGESSPSSTTSGQQGSASTPTGTANSSSNKPSTPPSAGQGSNGSANGSGSNAPVKSSSSKASKLNWNCVYNNSNRFPDSERPVAEMHQSMDHQSVVCCVRFSSDGTMMASGCHKTAQVFDVKTGDRKFIVSRPGSGGDSAATSEADDAYVRAVCFSPDCTKLVAGMPHNTIRVWDIASNEEGVAMTGHESEIYSLDYVNDLIVSGSGDRKVRLWDARNGQCKKVFGSESGGPSDGVTSVALSPDGRLIAAASLDKVVRIWDTESSQLLDRFEGHSDSVYSIAFSPDGKNVISGSLDRNIMLWDVNAQGRTTSRPHMVLQGHKDFVLSVAYTPDGRWLMSGSKDRSVVFWDPRSSRSVLTLTGYRNSVISVASSPASPYFATGSGDCFAVVWKYQCQSF